MPKLLECPGCTRHVRADDARCPFCGRPSTTAAPSRMLVLALPITLMACTAEAPAPASKPDATKPAPTEPVKKPSEPADGGAVADPVPEPDDRVRAPEYGAPIAPADGGAVAEPVPPTDDRVMATKYGGPPVMNDPGPPPVDSVDAAKPEEPRPAKKYGAPPRPAPKYGGAPKPGSGDPLGGP